MKQLILIVGPAGSGKSTLAFKLWKSNQSGNLMFIYEADQWMMEGSEYKFHPSKLEYCHRMCRTNTERALSDNHSVIVSNTTLRRKDLDVYIEIAAKYNYPVRVIRMQTRYRSIHGVPKDRVKIMEEMAKNFDWSNLPEFVSVEDYSGGPISL